MTRGRVRFRTQVAEALVGVSARPGRLVLTMLGEAIGLAALVATVGLAGTAGAQVSSSFDAAAAHQVTVQPEKTRGARGATIPDGAVGKVKSLEGVVSAGTLTRLRVKDAARSTLVTDPQGLAAPVLPVLAASAGVFETVDATIRGRTYDQGHVDRGDPVALLGREAANRLAIRDLGRGPAVFVGNRALTVIGIIDEVGRSGELLDAVVVPESTARRYFGFAGAGSLLIDVAPNAAETIARQAPLAIAPGDPRSIEATAPPSDTELREDVESKVSSLLVLLGLVCLVAGGVGIANIMLLSVMERVGEIGLRQALGATRGIVMSQFLVESAAIGLLGGIVGTSLGFVTTTVVALLRDWTPVLDSRLLAAPVAGLLVGVLSGAFPAWRAGSLEPVEALRSM